MFNFAKIFFTMNAERRTQKAERKQLQLNEVHAHSVCALELARRKVRVGSSPLHPKILLFTRLNP